MDKPTPTPADVAKLTTHKNPDAPGSRRSSKSYSTTG